MIYEYLEMKGMTFLSYLRDFSKLRVGLAALLCSLYSQLVVVQECSVNSELARLMERKKERKKEKRAQRTD